MRWSTKVAFPCIACTAVVLALCVAGCGMLQTGFRHSPGQPEQGVLTESDRAHAEALAHYSQALIHTSNGEHDAALAEYIAAAELNPQSDLCLPIALGYLRQDMPEKALSAVRECCERHPEQAQPQLWLAFVCRTIGQPAAADRACREAIRLEPELNRSYLELASSYVQRSDMTQALDVLSNGTKYAAEPLPLLEMQAELYLHLSTTSADEEEQATYRALAIGAFEQMLADSPDDPIRLLQLAELCIINSQPERSLEYLNHLAELDPQAMEIRQKLALGYAAVNEEEQAVALLESIIRDNPATSENYYFLGELHEKMNNPQQAAVVYREVIENGTESALPYLRLVQMQLPNNISEAIEIAREGLVQLPDDLRLHKVLAYLLLDADRADESVEVFEQTMKLLDSRDLPVSTVLQFKYALACFFAGNTEKASELLTELISVRPAFINAYVRLVLQNDDPEQIASAIQILKRTVAELEDPTLAYIYIGLLNRSLHDFEAALTAFELAETSADDDHNELDGVFYFWYGSCAERAGQFSRAVSLFETCLELSPDHAEALNYLAYMWAEKGLNLERAEEYVSAALDQFPDSGAFLDTRGWVYYMQGRYVEALEQIEAAHKHNSEDLTINDHLGDILATLKRTAEAIPYWERALLGDPENETIAAKLRAEGIDVEALLEEAPSLDEANGKTQ